MMLMDASPGTPPGMGWMREENRSDEKEGGKFGESVSAKRFGFEAGGEEKSEQEQWRVVGNRRVRRIARIRTHPAVNVVRLPPFVC